MDVLLCNILPVILVKSYCDPGNNKADILKENKGFSGIYRWTNNSSRNSYWESALDLSLRLRCYFSISYLKRVRSTSLIYFALLKYNHENFKLDILEYCEPPDLIKRISGFARGWNVGGSPSSNIIYIF